jgi:hypothetical protein
MVAENEMREEGYHQALDYFFFFFFFFGQNEKRPPGILVSCKLTPEVLILHYNYLGFIDL